MPVPVVRKTARIDYSTESSENQKSRSEFVSDRVNCRQHVASKDQDIVLAGRLEALMTHQVLQRADGSVLPSKQASEGLAKVFERDMRDLQLRENRVQSTLQIALLDGAASLRGPEEAMLLSVPACEVHTFCGWSVLAANTRRWSK